MVMQKISLEENQSENLVQQNIEHLEQIFPEVFSEGKVNFDTLRQLLGDQQVLDEGEEKYGLNWHGKKKARQSALTPSLGTLLPCPEESVDWDNTQNLFIEGDNLEVLKLLQKSYTNKVKMIYIDPPYNTGGEFIYPDNFKENLESYLYYTNQLDDEGNKLSSSLDKRGRKHTAWLNMMYPRLKLAQSLLKKEGVIFCSIDHHEHANLRSLFDEIFGEENFIGDFVWQSKKGGGSDNPLLVVDHENVICYAKNIDYTELGALEVQAEALNLNDEKGPYRVGRELNKWGANSRREDRPTMYFPIPGPNNEDVYPIRNDGTEGCWRWGKQKMMDIIKREDVLFSKREDGTYIVYEKIRDEENRSKPYRTWLDNVGTTADGSKAVKQIFDDRKVFSFPKPLNLLETLIEIGIPKKGILLDFFAGSGSSAHAALNVNKKRGLNAIRSISVQLPEKTEETTEAYLAGYESIAEICKSRIIKIGKIIGNENDELDTGIKVFKLAQSNIQPWNPDPTDLEVTLLESENHLIEGRTERDILYELLLKRGIDLATPIAERKVAEKTVYSIGYGATFACLDEIIQAGDIESIAQIIIDWYQELAPGNKPHIFFRDSAFENDMVKTNLAAILQQNGLDHVRSL